MAIQEEHDTSVKYRIRVKERIGPEWTEWFGNMRITNKQNETILEGQIRDQSALHGLLVRIRDLNLTLLSVRRIDVERNGDR